MRTHNRRRSFSRILCAIDFSSTARSALRYAAVLAERASADLAVVYVNDPLLVAAAAAAYDTRALAETTVRELQQFAVSAIGPQPKPSCLVVMGNPAREIDKLARRERSDLVVIGTRGLGDAGRLFFGSTAGRILRTADYPVLAVPPAPRASRPSPRWPARILAAIDLESHAARDVQRARRLAESLDAKAHYVTVVPPLQTPSWLRARTRDRDHARMLAARTRLRALAGAGRAGVHALVGDPGEQIGAAAVDVDADLIVLALHPADRPFGTRQGSVTYRVLCRTAVPVLAIDPGR